MSVDLSVKKLLKLNHLSKTKAKYFGLLSPCPRCRKLLIRHTPPQFQTCLIELAKKNDKTWNLREVREQLVKELKNE